MTNKYDVNRRKYLTVYIKNTNEDELYKIDFSYNLHSLKITDIFSDIEEFLFHLI